jgi:serine/threonine protein kinase
MRQPTKFGKYLLLERIAVGGMAEVFVAKAFGVEGFERLLAIKKILPTMGEDAEFISMFVDEARIAVQLSHANIVQVLELGKHDENLYIAMEYISGRDVRQLLERYRKRQQPMPIPQACLIVAEVCEALDYAHRKRDASGRPLGIVHRDVSPQNVLVSFEGEVKLIDFGIAKAESRLQKTQAGILKGKFSYMSPEQVKGQPIDGRSDIFAAGILLWELICGEKLFTGDSDFAILEKVRTGFVPAPRSVTRTCPEGLEKVILKALSTEPSSRYQTASEMHDDLMRFTLLGDMVYGSRQLAEWLREEFPQDWEKEQTRLRAWLEVEDEKSEVTPSDPHRRKGIPRIVPKDFGITPLDAFPGPALMNAIEAASSEPTQQFRIAPDQDTLVALPTPPKGVTPVQRPPSVDSHELPTMKMDDAALVEAEKEFAARQAALKEQPGAPSVSVAFGDADDRTEVDPPKRSAPPRVLPTPPRVELQKAAPPTPAPSPQRAAPSAPEVVAAKPPMDFDLSNERTGAPRKMRSNPMARPVKAQAAPAAKSSRRALYVGAPLLLAGLAALFFILQPDEETRPGKIVVTPAPSVTADLFIDGKSAGQLPPFVHVVAAGGHRIEVRAEGYKPFSTQVQVPSGGRPLAIDAQLTSDRPMQVEGVVLTQPKPAPLAEKTESAPTPDPSRTKRWWQKKNAVASHKPEPAPDPASQSVPQPAPVVEQPAPAKVVVTDNQPRLRIVTEPPGAEVRVDGKVIGTSPVTTAPLDPGPYHPVIATLDGYAPARRAARLDPAGTTELTLTFEMEAPKVVEAAPVPAAGVGYLTAATKPAARLTIDGRDTGRWTPVPPANPIALPAGAHTLLFETADGRRLEEQLEIEPGKTSRVIRSLP